MAFLSGLFRAHPGDEVSDAAVSVVERVMHPSVAAPSPNLPAFQAALEAVHAAPPMIVDTGSGSTAMGQLGATTSLLEQKQFVLAIAQARDLMTRHPTVIPSSMNIIGAAFFGLHFYREAVRHYAAAARFDPYFTAMVKNLTEVHLALRATSGCRLSRLVLAVLATEAFDGVIDSSAVPNELIGALLARGETARRLGAPHLALHDFSRASQVEDRPSTRAMIVMAASDLGDAEALTLAPEARQSAAFGELDSRLAMVLPQWEAAAREEWAEIIKKLEALE